MNRRTVGLIILITLCAFSCAKQPQKSTVREYVYREGVAPEWYNNDSLLSSFYYTEAMKYVALEDKEKSIDYLQKVLEIDSLHAPANNQMSRSLLEREQFDQALTHAIKAIDGDSVNIEYLENYGYALSMVGDYKKARGVYRQLIIHDPSDPNNYRLAAILYATTGMPHMAISILDSANYKLGHYDVLVEMKRDLLLEVGLFGRAIREAQSMIANDPQNIEYYLDLGAIYEGIEEDSLAEATYRSALLVEPANVNTLVRLSDFYLSWGRENDFLQIVQRLFRINEVDVDMKLEIYDKWVVADEAFYRRNFFAINTIASVLHVKYPNNEEVEMRYANHLIRAGEWDQALLIFKKLAHNPNTKEPKEAILTVMSIENHMGHTDSMKYYLDLAIQRLPNDSELYLRKAYLHIEEGDDLLASESLEKAVEVATDSLAKSDAYTALADFTTDFKKSKKHYTKALEYNPNNAMAMNNFAYFSGLAGEDLPYALELSTRACELETTNATYLDTKAWILYLMGRYSEAKIIMQQAISLNSSNDPTLFLHYADILAVNGDTFLAEIYYKRAAEAGEDEQVIRKRLEELKKPKN